MENPKEVPKQEMRKVCKCKRAYENPLSEICSLCWNELYPNEKDEIKDEDLLEPKQETLEEAAERYWAKQPYDEDAFIEGAKWQAERMYSEEEVLKFSEWIVYEVEHYGCPTDENIIKAIKEIKRILRQ